MSLIVEGVTFLQNTGRSLEPRASIHAGGKISFNKAAAAMMGLDEKPNLFIGVPQDDEGNALTDAHRLVVVRFPADADVEGGFKAAKGGAAYYVNAKSLLSQLEDFEYGRGRYNYRVTKAEFSEYDDFMLTNINEEALTNGQAAKEAEETPKEEDVVVAKGAKRSTSRKK